MAKKETVISNIRTFAARIAAEKLSAEKGDIISMRLDSDTILATAKDADFSGLRDEDFIEVKLSVPAPEYALLAAIYVARTELNAVIHTCPVYCGIVARCGRKIPAVLDDMAQIIGPTCRVAKSAAPKDVLAGLRGRNGCLIRDNGVLTSGRTLDEAYTATLVLEKAAKVYVNATAVGGAKIINLAEALLMHVIYKKKYSKADQSQKLEEME